MFDKNWREFLQNEINTIKESGRYSEETALLSVQGVKVVLQKNGKIYHALNFCANNYLGLASNWRLRFAAIKAVMKWGYGVASVRFICGTQKIHKDLESKIASFLKKEDAITYSSCFDSNGGLFEALLKTDGGDKNLTKEFVLISDELNHASLIDGARLTKVEKRIYRHSDMDDLENQLKETRNRKLKIIVTDGVFSMDGDIARLPEICELAQTYSALVAVDDSHATGFMGMNGTGSAGHYGILDQVDIITSTFGKALGGGIGGFTAGPKKIIETLRQRSRPYRFSNSLLPAACQAALTAFQMTNTPKLVRLRLKLRENMLYFRTNIKKLGFEIKDGRHPIVPVMIRDAKLAQELAQKLLENGILAVAFSYPVVKKNEDRIRIQISAAHTKTQIDKCLSAFQKAGKELKMIN